MLRMLRLSLALLALAGPLAGCKKATEVVLRLEATAAPPSQITVRLHRSKPFDDNPTGTPPFVVAQINGAGLELLVTPQGASTTLSILPSKSGPKDLTV